jgi:c-di-GMP-binding flagellar brake protein YcgR
MLIFYYRNRHQEDFMYPKVNQNIMIDIIDYELSCRSNIAEIGQSEIHISIPLDREIIGLLSLGIKLEITYLTGESKFQFTTEILGRTTDTIPLLRLAKPKENEITKIQQRENVRVNANLRLVIAENELHTINISAGGLLFSSKLDSTISQGEEITGTLYVPDFRSKEIVPVPFKGKVIRVNLMREIERSYVALEFTSIKRPDQMKIIQHCFEKQRQIRLKVR